MKAFLKLLKCIKVLVFIFTCLIYKSTNAQYAIAGGTVGIYTDVPDTIIGAGQNDDFYYMDINQDGVNDIIMNASLHYYGGGAHYYHVAIGGVDTNVVKFSFLRKSSCVILVGVSSNMLRSYNYGDTIKKWNYIALGTYLAFDSKLGDGSICADRTFSTNAYIGVRYATNIDTAYGWIGVDVLDYGTVRIKDFALEKNPVVGIKELKDESLKLSVYPNPASSIITIELEMMNEKEIEISILDVLGKEVIHNSLSSTHHFQIDVSGLPNGIYFAQIKTDKGIGARKIVVQR